MNIKGTRFTLLDKYPCCDNTLVLRLKPLEKEFIFKAGQHISITIPEPKFTDKEGDTRYFSIASAPSVKEYIMIAARISGSAFSKNISAMNLGDEVIINGPEGSLAIHEDAGIPAVFIAGGLGVTPFRSIIEEDLLNKSKRKIYLFYSNNSFESSAFMDDFFEWAKGNDNIGFVPTINDINNKEWKYEYGLIDDKMISKYLIGLQEYIYYIAGPPAMVDFVKDNLEKLQVTPDRIKTEKF